MADYGLIGGFGEGLKSFMGAYQSARKNDEEQKYKNIALKLMAAEKGYKPDDIASGILIETPEHQLKSKLETAQYQEGLDSRNALSTRSSNRRGFVRGLLGQAGINNQNLIPDTMSENEIDSSEKYLTPVISGEYGLKKERILANKEKTKDPTDAQFNAAMFGKRAQEADKIIQDIGNYRTTPGGVIDSKAPGFLMSTTAKSIDQAERNFVNSILRRESGAAISKDEFDNAEKQYFPRAGDTPDVIAQKAQNRAQVVLGLQAASSNAWNKVPLATGPLQTGAPKKGMVRGDIATGGTKPVRQMSRKELLQELGQ